MRESPCRQRVSRIIGRSADHKTDDALNRYFSLAVGIQPASDVGRFETHTLEREVCWPLVAPPAKTCSAARDIGQGLARIKRIPPDWPDHRIREWADVPQSKRESNSLLGIAQPPIRDARPGSPALFRASAQRMAASPSITCRRSAHGRFSSLL